MNNIKSLGVLPPDNVIYIDFQKKILPDGQEIIKFSYRFPKKHQEDTQMPAFRLVLSLEQIAELSNALNKARRQGDLTVVNRILAVLAFGEGEYTDFPVIGKLFRVSGEAVRQWVSKYMLSGVEGLLARKRAPGRPPRLNKTHRRELARLIEDGPQRAGFPGGCWRTPMLQKLIHQRFGVFLVLSLSKHTPSNTSASC